MVDGAVSIAALSVYPGKQARIMSCKMLQNAKKTAGKVVRRAKGFVGNE
jgi:hypothetical protein